MRIVLTLPVAAVCLVCAAVSSVQAQNFYCTTEQMVAPDRLRDPTYQVKRPGPADSEFTILSSYEFFLHNGKLGISSGGYTHTFTGVALKGRREGASIYADRKGNRWTLTPLGGNRIRIAGPRVDDGAAVAVGCNGPEAAPAAPASSSVPFPWQGPRAQIKAYVQKQGGMVDRPNPIAFYGDFNNDGQEDALVFIYTYLEGSAGSSDLDVVLFKGTGGGFQFMKRVPDVFGQQPRQPKFSNGLVEITTTILRSGDPRCCPTGSKRYAIRTQ